ncbi:hypothetical protein HMY34_17440 [Thiothrix subterranea]|uniref:hypothetical protein n=1 Tax=Thiothrix subterranea TaxID=2735563 RepID=UPI00192B021B|nr:hypothetical protein [Thiothrix subterranea]QQZ30397.1 hypothetical protein HMY34_17440 [Thiothrix subterranea]
MSNPAIETVKAIKRCIQRDFFANESSKDSGIYQLTIVDEKSRQELNINTKNAAECLLLSTDVDRNKDSNQAKSIAKDSLLPFFEPTESGITQQCDLILIGSRDENLFVFLIEMKQANKGHYLQQMKSSKLFVNFVLEILTLHSKCTAHPPHFFGVLCYGDQRRARNQPSKHLTFQFEERNGLHVSEWYASSINLPALLSAALRCVQGKAA